MYIEEKPLTAEEQYEHLTRLAVKMEWMSQAVDCIRKAGAFYLLADVRHELNMLGYEYDSLRRKLAKDTKDGGKSAAEIAAAYEAAWRQERRAARKGGAE